MEFRKDVKTVSLLNPLRKFELDFQSIEYRQDPLTNSRSRINISRAGRARQAQRGQVNLRQISNTTREGCFFCPENIEHRTPRFPENICPQGRIKRGDCLVFPNLFPFAEYHAVGTLTSKHFLDLHRFTPEMLIDNIKASQEYLISVYRSHKQAIYPLWIWNYLPPSAASIIHPHVQILLDGKPTPELDRILSKSEQYFLTQGRNYWLELIEEEKALGQRYIGENDSAAVIASYAPRGNREVQIIFKEVSNLADLDEKQISDFAHLIIAVLHAYKKMGVNSFNLVTYSAPMNEKLKYFSLNAKLISRPPLEPFYTSDTGFMERLCDEWVIETLPEDVAQQVRKLFQTLFG